MRRFVDTDSKASWMVAVWVLSCAIALGFIWTTLQKSPHHIILPVNFNALVAHKDVLVGSSLSLAALPDDDRYANVLSPDRATLVASLQGISESHSISIFRAAVAADAHTVLLEANAYAHEFNGLRNHPWAATLANLISETGRRLTLVARAAAGLSATEHGRVRLGRLHADQQEFELMGPVEPLLFPRNIWDTAGLEEALADARRHGIRVLLFWPPLPEGGFGRDPVRYAEISDHVRALAKQYALPVWVPSAPWPDQLFMDNFGHLNARGRVRFAAEIGAWARSL